MAEINLSKYGISGTTEIVHNPSYEMLFEEETKPESAADEAGTKKDGTAAGQDETKAGAEETETILLKRTDAESIQLTLENPSYWIEGDYDIIIKKPGKE